MLHDHLVHRVVCNNVSISVNSPLPMPIPVSVETSDAILAMLADRDITYTGGSIVQRLEPASRRAHLAAGGSLEYDLFLGIPVHRAPPLLLDAGLAEDGRSPVEPG